jgi:hypothetical protein
VRRRRTRRRRRGSPAPRPAETPTNTNLTSPPAGSLGYLLKINFLTCFFR